MDDSPDRSGEWLIPDEARLLPIEQICLSLRQSRGGDDVPIGCADSRSDAHRIAQRDVRTTIIADHVIRHIERRRIPLTAPNESATTTASRDVDPDCRTIRRIGALVTRI